MELNGHSIVTAIINTCLSQKFLAFTNISDTYLWIITSDIVRMKLFMTGYSMMCSNYG
jgi:hypothetical protein